MLIKSKQLGYMDTVLPSLGTTVQAALDSAKGLFIARATASLNLAALQALPGSTATVNVGSALPASARVLGAEVIVAQGFSGTLLTAALATVQGQGDAAGSLVAASTLLAAASLATPGLNPYLSRGGQQLQATIALTGIGFSSLTGGAVTFNVFYAAVA